MVFVFFSKSPDITNINKQTQNYSYQDTLHPSTFTSPQMFGENFIQSIFNHFLGSFNKWGHMNAFSPFFERNGVPLPNDESQFFVTNLEDNKIAYVARSHREKDNISMYESFVAYNIPYDNFPIVFPQLENGSLNNQNNMKYLP